MPKTVWINWWLWSISHLAVSAPAFSSRKRPRQDVDDVQTANCSVVKDSINMAEREGFEPPEGCPSTVFKTAAFVHSATSPFCGTDLPDAILRIAKQADTEVS